MLSVRLLPKTDPNLTHCAERTNAFTACSSSEDDHLSTPSISPHGVHCQRRGRCQIPWRMSTHLPTQRCKVSTMAANTTSHCLHSKSLAAPNTSNTTLALTKRTAASSTALLVVAHTTYTNRSLPSYIEGATYATLTSSIEGLAALRRPCQFTHSQG